MKFVFKWRRLFRDKYSRWENPVVIGNSYEKDLDRMLLYFEDGSIKEICSWSSCEVELGQDWLLATKKQMEKQSGQNISVNHGEQ